MCTVTSIHYERGGGAGASALAEARARTMAGGSLATARARMQAERSMAEPLNAHQAAELAGVHITTITRAVADGDLHMVRIDDMDKLDAAQVKAWARRKRLIFA